MTFCIPYEELAIWNARMQRVVESGEFVIMVGHSSENIDLTGSVYVQN